MTTALKHGYAITIGNNMWFPSPLDTSSVNERGVHGHLGWLAHESVHMLDYDRVGIEAYLTSYIQKAVVAGFSHDDIPDERRADRFESAALRLLSRSPELARLISTCDNDAILADLASRGSIYRQALVEALPEEHEEIERIEAQSPEEGIDEPKRSPGRDVYESEITSRVSPSPAAAQQVSAESHVPAGQEEQVEPEAAKPAGQPQQTQSPQARAEAMIGELQPYFTQAVRKQWEQFKQRVQVRVVQDADWPMEYTKEAEFAGCGADERLPQVQSRIGDAKASVVVQGNR